MTKILYPVRYLSLPAQLLLKILLQLQILRNPEHNNLSVAYKVPVLPIGKLASLLFLARRRPTATAGSHSGGSPTGRGRQSRETADGSRHLRLQHSRRRLPRVEGLRRSQQCDREPSAEPAAGPTSRRCQAPTNRCLATGNRADQGGTALTPRWRHPWQPTRARRTVPVPPIRLWIHRQISTPKQYGSNALSRPNQCNVYTPAAC